MSDMKGQKIVLVAQPQASAQSSDFEMKDFKPPTPSDGQVLVKVNYLSLDPYMRNTMNDRKSGSPSAKVGEVMPGETISTVISSNHQEFAEGDLVLAKTGWCTHAVVEAKTARKIVPGATAITTRLGVLGMPGLAAYAGLKDVGRPQKGETVVVAAAAGPVGSLVAQLARLTGARAVGIAGGPDKCAYLRDELKLDGVVDHRSSSFRQDLEVACPKGIDVSFENVGGAVWQAVLPLLNQHARVPLGGLISNYDSKPNGEESGSLLETMEAILHQRLLVQGFLVFEYTDSLYEQFQREVSQGIVDGRIKYREDIADGLENAPAAFLGMFEGKNFGKLIVRVSEPQSPVQV
jgi:hypothetical protein